MCLIALTCMLPRADFSLNKSTLEAEEATKKVIIGTMIIMTPALCFCFGYAIMLEIMQA